MVITRSVSASDFEQIYPLLDWHDPTLDKQVWRRIFDYAWEHDEPHCGYGLFDGDEAVGFIGFIFSERTLSRRTVHFCNLTTWIVRPDYRSHSLSLMMPVVRMKDYTITDLSAGDDVVKLSKHLGFKDLDTEALVLLPHRSRAPTLRNPIVTGDAIAHCALNPSDFKIFSDHRVHPHCHQLVYPSAAGNCHVIYTLNPDETLSYSHIQLISDPTLFVHHHLAIRQQIMHESGFPLIVIDARLLSGDLPFSYRLPLSTPRIYRSSQLAPHQVDNLYSELTLLNFSTTDSLTLGWREKALTVFSSAIKRLARCS